MIESIIRARRDALAEQMAQAQQQYEQLEQTLKLLDRQLCAMAGGLQELDALLTAIGADERNGLCARADAETYAAPA